MILIFTEMRSNYAHSALTLLVGWQEGHPTCKNWVVGAGVVICLERGADFHMAQLMPLPLTVSCFSKIRLVLPFWYQLNRVVPDKGPLLLMPLPLTVSCFSKIQIGFTFLVPAHLGRPGQRAVTRVCICVCVCVWNESNIDVLLLVLSHGADHGRV